MVKHDDNCEEIIRKLKEQRKDIFNGRVMTEKDKIEYNNYVEYIKDGKEQEEKLKNDPNFHDWSDDNGTMDK